MKNNPTISLTKKGFSIKITPPKAPKSNSAVNKKVEENAQALAKIQQATLAMAPHRPDPVDSPHARRGMVD